MLHNTVQCPLCRTVKDRPLIKKVDRYSYHQCIECDFIFIDYDILNSIDNGKPVFQYHQTYWKQELEAAKERSWGPAMARMSECFHYCRIPINSFIDIGSGPGYFLDAVNHFLPASSNKFFGWEKYPPQAEFQTKHQNYFTSDLKEINIQFQAGLCMEVIEHLTPKQVYNLMLDLANKTDDGAFFIFNTGLTDYVLKEDMDYLDPVTRGHISIWSVRSLNILLNELRYSCYAIGKKTWAVGIEYKGTKQQENNIDSRIWKVLPENSKVLEDASSGSVIKILGLESARAYQ